MLERVYGGVRMEAVTRLLPGYLPIGLDIKFWGVGF
ncbi:hypothetical protein FHS09_000598 [Microbulbifer rhizosphaerae]|uniref:Uncharacterized protein n=1 Tax=Microbulbifer rhizosphaerae TaxID=1562603 RepID=A0A7W4W8R7_9GAMM|nr:hypothetical protein [Microbulbifer rhizosphaerae]